MLSQQLVQKQTQKLLITPELRQSIELLPLSTLELADKIQAELIENPMLEETSSSEKTKMPELFSMSEIRSLEKREHSKSTDINYSDIYNIERPGSNFYDNEASDRNQSMIEASPIREKLSDHLLSQFRLLKVTEEQIYIAEVLISMLDDKGFITSELKELALEANLEYKTIAKVLKIIQSLDPIGIGSSSVEETLYIQAIILKPE